MSRQTAISTNTVSKADRPEGDDFFKMQPAWLTLADGTSYRGMSPSWQTGENLGEVVFNTGMTGYVESLTDPSYAGQILIFTYPLIGNYGVPDSDRWESEKIHVAGIVVSEACAEWSHSGSKQSLLGWLKAQGVPILTDADTRAMTKHLREHRTMSGILASKKVVPKSEAVIPRISIPEPIIYNEGRSKTVILVDCGVKLNILRSLLELDATVKRVPHDYDYTNEDYDGVLLSNGPGDPTDYPETIRIAAKAFKTGKPVFGICLGSQIMGLAAGAKTYKLPYGHRGHNQPCMTHDQACFITSQNHGYALDAKTLPKGWRVLFRNLNDDSVEGIEHESKPYFAVQFHPEATPGPTDTAWLFGRFKKSL